jgi:hypothetical protein
MSSALDQFERSLVTASRALHALEQTAPTQTESAGETRCASTTRAACASRPRSPATTTASLTSFSTPATQSGLPPASSTRPQAPSTPERPWQTSEELQSVKRHSLLTSASEPRRPRSRDRHLPFDGAS